MSYYLKSIENDSIKFQIGDFTTIGKDRSCQIPIDGTDVSDRHARLEWRNQKLWLRDLRSISGSFVNDVRVQEAQIEAGDVLKFGNSQWFVSNTDRNESQFKIKSRNLEWNQKLQTLGSISKTDFPVLLLGPSGTGKDIIAQEIHASSQRCHFPFISVNCSALTETLVESELFGHIKGSFTGAINDRKGAFEAARGGTLFLDEIGDLPLSLQAKLLRALENNEIRPVGADRPIKTDVRIIAATHQNLNEKILDGHFRSDLFYRLNVMSINPPALCDRMEDFDDFIYQFAKKLRVRFSFMAIHRLKKHSWPGNIRELKNVVARASVLHKGELIDEGTADRLIDRAITPPPTGTVPYAASTHTTGTLPVIKEIEKQMIIKRLAANHGNQRRTALDLGMPKSTLHDRLKFYQIDIEQFKA